MIRSTIAAGLLAAGSWVAAAEPPGCRVPLQSCLEQMVQGMGGRGWVGVEYDPAADNEIVIKHVVPGSPAARAGLQGGDRLVAMNGLRLAEADDSSLERAYGGWRPGNEVRCTVAREGREFSVRLELGRVPREVLALWIGTHVLDQHWNPNER